MWFDPPAGAVDPTPLDAKAVAMVAGLLCAFAVLVLIVLDPLATTAAASLGTH